MAEFEVKVVAIDDIREHPNADRLELATIGGYQSVVQKGQFKRGQKAVYIPEQAVLPDQLIRDLGLWNEEKDKGNLAGKTGNRVKIIRLRGEYSQGILYPVESITVGGFCPDLDDDMSHILGIEKYEPAIPPRFRGELGSTGIAGFSFDVENWKKYPDILEEGEPVVFTEKIHGTFQVVGLLPDHMHHPEMIAGRYFTTSKGYLSRGIWLKDNEANAENIYIRSAKLHALGPRLEDEFGSDPAEPIWLLGETYGVQKGFKYDASSLEPGFRAFAIKEHFTWLDHDEFADRCRSMHIRTVPVLYDGPFSTEAMKDHTDGQTRAGAAHMREGIVMVPKPGRRDLRIGQVILKSVSERYLMKSTGEEIN